MNNRPEVERLLTIAQAAEEVNFDESVIIEWMERGLPFIASKIGKSRPRMKDRRIRATALWQWVGDLEIRRMPPAPTPTQAETNRRLVAQGRAAGSKSLSAWREDRKAKE